MATTVITESVDIYQLPQVRDDAYKTSEITLGDLHANPIKLLFYLIREGISTLSQTDYQHLVQLYLKWNTLNGQPLIQAMHTFKSIVTQMNIVNKTIRLRLLGDELADRGCSDWLVLMILEKLGDEHINMKIVLSNHLAEFIEALEYYEERKRLSLGNPQGAPADFLYGSSISPQNGVTQSLGNLSCLLQFGLVDIDHICQIFDFYYKKNLCLLDLDEDCEKIFIFSHAPIGLKAIFQLASHLDISYQNRSLLAIINDIHHYFDLHYLNGIKKISSLYLEMQSPLQHIIHYFLWNRDGDHERLMRKAIYQDQSLLWVHGHDYGSELPDWDNRHVVNLDNMLGKQLHSNQGTYKILIKEKR